MRTLIFKTPVVNFEADRLAIEGALDLVNGTCTDPDCHGDHDPRHAPRARLFVAYARGIGPLPGTPLTAIGDGVQWLEVTCSECGVLAYGEQDELEAAEKMQVDHAETKPGHRVNVELFFRECATRVERPPAPHTPAPDDITQLLDRN